MRAGSGVAGAVRVAAITGAVLLGLTACAPGSSGAPVVIPPSQSDPASDAPSAGAPPSSPPPALRTTDETEVLAEGLAAPWSVVRLPGGGVLVSERDSARIVEVLPDGSLREVVRVPGVVPGGEGGLLGLAFLAGVAAQPDRVYAFHTAASDNRIVRMPLTGEPGALALGSPEPVLTGIPKAGNHNGGRLAFGPDGLLYATTGDAGNRDAAQDPGSLAGKILRMTPAGDPASGNPFGSHVWSLGHRNPQGLAWDAAGGLWAAEFGQNTWDELNRITPGGNYGWPVVEGQAGDPRFTDPAVQWPTTEASPSGLAIVGDTLFLTALRGARLWEVTPLTTGAPLEVTAAFTGELGRLRDAVPGPDGELWILTNNTDGRGSPREGDDRLLRVVLAPRG